MQEVLSRPSVPVTCNSGHVSQAKCSIIFRCHDRHFRDAVVHDESGDLLFTLGAKGIFSSWSVRRTLRDADEKHILDVRHYKSNIKEWIIEDPKGNQLCLVKDEVSKVEKITSLHAQVTAENVVGGHFTVNMQSVDRAGTKTTLEVEGAVIAEMHLVENNDINFLDKRGIDRSAWRIEVAGGVDLALVIALAYCRAEISHAWRR